MQGQRLGMLSLRLDAVYCLILGVAVALTASAIAGWVTLPPAVIVAAGMTVVAWAGLVEWMRARLDLRLALRIVMAANIAAALGVAFVSLAVAAVIAAVAVLAVAVDIALFAGSQALALGRLRADD